MIAFTIVVVAAVVLAVGLARGTEFLGVRNRARGERSEAEHQATRQNETRRPDLDFDPVASRFFESGGTE